MCLKCNKCGRKFVMLCRKAKNAEVKGVAHNIFAPPPGRFSPTPEKSPKPAPDLANSYHYRVNMRQRNQPSASFFTCNQVCS